jgi:hypothetical protein
VLIIVGAVLCAYGRPVALASSPPPLAQAGAATSASAFVVLTQPVKIKMKYGETVLPAGTKLQVVSSDATTVQIRYMGEIQTIGLESLLIARRQMIRLP